MALAFVVCRLSSAVCQHARLVLLLLLIHPTSGADTNLPLDAAEM